MGKKEDKTNVMRVLDKNKVPYISRKYEPNSRLTGNQIANTLGENPSEVFKTLVTVGKKSKEHYVFMIPVNKELDLKKCAKAVNEKNIEMILQKDLLGLTGYVHGGCSPIGMKKQFVTTIDETANSFESIKFSAGKVGYQVEVKFEDLKKVLNLNIADLTKDN